MREATIEERGATIRTAILDLERAVQALLIHSVFRNENCRINSPNIPDDQHSNMKANITLAFRHLEDARMRIGKVLQAYQGGTSILDK